MANILIFGAGASGRGHMGQLAFESGCRLALLDRDAGLCRTLREAGSYRVRLVSAHTRTVTVDGFSVHHTSEAEAFCCVALLSWPIAPPICVTDWLCSLLAGD